LAELPQLEPGFLLYIGGMDLRKNIWGLLDAYAGIGADLRYEHQLVVVCALTRNQRRRARTQAEELGISERVYFTGYVPDDQLLHLCQTVPLSFPHLFVAAMGALEGPIEPYPNVPPPADDLA